MAIYRGKNGRLFIQFEYKKKLYKKYLPEGTSKSDAGKVESKWKTDILFEEMGMGGKKDIEYNEFLIKYFLPFAKKHYSAAGFKNVKVICEDSLPFLEDKTLRKITPADIEKFKQHREKLPTKHDTRRLPATIHRELNIISKIFSYAIRQDYLEFNPCAKVSRPSVENIQDKIIPIDKLPSFLDNFNSAWARDVAILILNTGLRQNDALGLKKKDADFDNRILRLIQGKSKRAVMIPMNETVYQLLLSKAENGSELFFPSPKTGKQGVSIKKALLHAGNKIGIEKVGTRVLRRTFGTMLAEMNFDSGAIAKLLGHADLKTLHRYRRETQILRDAVEALDKQKPNQNLPKRKRPKKRTSVKRRSKRT